MYRKKRQNVTPEEALELLDALLSRPENQAVLKRLKEAK